MSSVYDWSVIAADNANADTSINWAEGQAPSTVNNSARVMMARLKELLNDLGGVAVAAGTANSITVTASSGFTVLANGLRLAFRAVAANAGAATLNVNNSGQKAIVKMTRYGEQQLTGAEIQPNGIYEVVYLTLLNGGAGAWLILNPSNVDVTPPGAGAPFFGNFAPPGWLVCNGAAVSRTTYARLFGAIGTAWGAGDGLTTFNLPNARDNFLRGAGAFTPFAAFQMDEIRSHNHTGQTAPAGLHSHALGAGYLTGGGSFSDRLTRGGPERTSPDGEHAHFFTTNNTGGSETRPRNIAVHWIIKT